VGGAGAVGGVGAVGGGGAVSGTAGVAGALCTDSDATNWAETRGTTVGLDGTYTDTCDENFNLIEHSCEFEQCFPLEARDAAMPNPSGGASGIGIPCAPMLTGNVIATPVDCRGRCSEGACREFCADFDDVFNVMMAVPGQAVILIHAETGQAVSCKAVVELGFDCTADALEGTSMTVMALGACSPAYFTMGITYDGTDPAEDCAYECEIADLPPEI
jgi:hypothetical protein